jgi:hypothetical protein
MFLAHPQVFYSFIFILYNISGYKEQCGTMEHDQYLLNEKNESCPYQYYYLDGGPLMKKVAFNSQEQHDLVV